MYIYYFKSEESDEIIKPVHDEQSSNKIELLLKNAASKKDTTERVEEKEAPL